MTAKDLQDRLNEFIDEAMCARDDSYDAMVDPLDLVRGIRSVATFESADIPTPDQGLVIECDDGTEFQVTILRSK